MDMDRWRKLGLSRQLGNIASEINRAGYWREKPDDTEAKKCLGRALDLLSLTIDCHATKGRKELTRFYEILASHYAQKPLFQISLRSLENFCLSHKCGKV